MLETWPKILAGVSEIPFVILYYSDCFFVQLLSSFGIQKKVFAHISVLAIRETFILKKCRRCVILPFIIQAFCLLFCLLFTIIKQVCDIYSEKIPSVSFGGCIWPFFNHLFIILVIYLIIQHFWGSKKKFSQHISVLETWLVYRKLFE